MPLVIAAPAVVVAAIFALLFVLAWHQWRGVIVSTLSIDLPIVGNVIGNLVAEGLDIVYANVAPWLDAALTPLVNLMIGPIRRVLQFEASTYGAFTRIKGDIATLVLQVIPGIAAGTITAALDYSNQVLAQAQLLISDALGSIESGLALVIQQISYDAVFTQQYVDDQVAALRAQIATQVGTATLDLTGINTLIAQYVVNGVNQAEAFTQQAYDAATAYAGSLAVTAEQDIAKAIATSEAYAATTATAIAGTIVTDLDQAITGALAGIYTDLDIAIDDVTAVIGAGDIDILAGIRAIPRINVGDIAGVATLAGATALTLTRYLKDCGIPNCQNLSGLGNDLQALLALVGDASFLAFLVALVHDPKGASGLVKDTFGAVIDGATTTAKDLLGV